MTAHIADHAAALAALPERDPERVAAYEHAAACPDCAAALAEGERLVSLLESAPVEPPSQRALARVVSAVLSEFDGVPKPVVVQAPNRAVAAFAVVMSLLLAWLDAHGGELAVGVGVECASIELGAALGALAIAFAASRRGYGALPSAAVVAGWGAFAGQAYLHFRCPVHHDAPHVFAFHVAAVVAAVLVGALWNPKWSQASSARAN